MKDKLKCCIVNPEAGKGLDPARRDKLALLADKYLSPAEILFVGEEDSISGVTRELQEAGFGEFYVYGGDGTVHGVINGLALPDPQVKLGIIGGGTANDMRRNCGVPRNTERALRVLSQGYYAPIDLGVANGMRFISTVSGGLDAEINREASVIKPRIRGIHPILAYIPATLRAIMRQRKQSEIVLQVDKETSYRGSAVITTVTNAPSYGSGFKVNPQAKMDDGQLNLCLLKKTRSIFLPLDMLIFACGMHVHLKNRFLFYEFKRAQIQSTEDLHLQLDGEDYGKTREISIAVLPGAVSIFFNPQFALTEDPVLSSKPLLSPTTA